MAHHHLPSSCFDSLSEWLQVVFEILTWIDQFTPICEVGILAIHFRTCPRKVLCHGGHTLAAIIRL